MYIVKGKDYVKTMNNFDMVKFLKVVDSEYLKDLEIIDMYEESNDTANMVKLAKHISNIKRVA